MTARVIAPESRSRARSSRPLSTALVAVVVVQCCQALVWMTSGLIIGIGDGLRRDDPAAAVLVIAAIVVFSIGGFGFGLALGMITRSDECRVASAVFQIVFATLFLVGAFVVIRVGHGGVLSAVLDPAARLAAPLTLVMPASCAVAAILLLVPRVRPIA